MVLTFKKLKRAKPSKSKKLAYGRRETKQYPVLPPLPCNVKKSTALLEKWVKDRVINLHEVEYLLSLVD